MGLWVYGFKGLMAGWFCGKGGGRNTGSGDDNGFDFSIFVKLHNIDADNPGITVGLFRGTTVIDNIPLV